MMVAGAKATSDLLGQQTAAAATATGGWSWPAMIGLRGINAHSVTSMQTEPIYQRLRA